MTRLTEKELEYTLIISVHGLSLSEIPTEEKQKGGGNVPKVTLDRWREDARSVLRVGVARGQLRPETAAKKLGISRGTWFLRMKDPANIRIGELHTLTQMMELTDDEILRIVKRS